MSAFRDGGRTFHHHPPPPPRPPNAHHYGYFPPSTINHPPPHFHGPSAEMGMDHPPPAPPFSFPPPHHHHQQYGTSPNQHTTSTSTPEAEPILGATFQLQSYLQAFLPASYVNQSITQTAPSSYPAKAFCSNLDGLTSPTVEGIDATGQVTQLHSCLNLKQDDSSIVVISNGVPNYQPRSVDGGKVLGGDWREVGYARSGRLDNNPNGLKAQQHIFFIPIKPEKDPRGWFQGFRYHGGGGRGRGRDSHQYHHHHSQPLHRGRGGGKGRSSGSSRPSIMYTPLGPIGVVVNGVPLFNEWTGQGQDAVEEEAFDAYGGHPDRRGQYHYHQFPKNVRGVAHGSTTTATTTTVIPLAGRATPVSVSSEEDEDGWVPIARPVVKAANEEPSNLNESRERNSFSAAREEEANRDLARDLNRRMASDLLSLVAHGGHSPIIGYAFDGFPIYGPIGWINDERQAKVMQSSYRLSIEGGGGGQEYVPGHGDLDECNGIEGPTTEYPEGIYHYHCTIDATKLEDGLVEAIYPYLLARYRGAPDKRNFPPHALGGGIGGNPHARPRGPPPHHHHHQHAAAPADNTHFHHPPPLPYHHHSSPPPPPPLHYRPPHHHPPSLQDPVVGYGKQEGNHGRGVLHMKGRVFM